MATTEFLKLLDAAHCTVNYDNYLDTIQKKINFLFERLQMYGAHYSREHIESLVRENERRERQKVINQANSTWMRLK